MSIFIGIITMGLEDRIGWPVSRLYSKRVSLERVGISTDGVQSKFGGRTDLLFSKRLIEKTNCHHTTIDGKYVQEIANIFTIRDCSTNYDG
ncbi:hypothetical protein TNCT_659431 [Trichonephila clavata]|uniref:Uncharacterized protein n=1 Tax=Trichonephila clavata TaxID=2740835 RepID=A0A8X6GPK0_TRICU|nr:hypothetical protein TNCT_659431 [Trichonephila clavata]